MKTDVILGDCKEVLKGLGSDSLDSLVTDPPAGIQFMGKAWDSFDSLMHFQDDMSEVFKEVLRVLKPGAHGLVWSLPRTSHHTGMALERAGFEIRDTVTHLFGTGMPKGHNITKAGAGTTWEGWNTALKPAHEVWWLVRKPLAEKTVAAQVLSTGTGAINVDACRVEFQNAEDKESAFPGGKLTSRGDSGGGFIFGADEAERTRVEFQAKQSEKGRYPANVVLSHTPQCEEGHCVDGCAVSALDDSSGFLPGAGNKGTIQRTREALSETTYGTWKGLNDNPDYYGGLRRASRFFYTSKVPPSERKLPDGTLNNHPTTKSIKLMQYFVKLITQPGGVVLDPFAGSGTTGVAALREGMSFVGIERDPEHHRVAQLRVEAEAASNDTSVLDLALGDD